MEFPDPEINRYAEEWSTPESKLLKKINRDTWAEVLMPRMLSGHMQGRILSMLSHMIRPKRVLEVGTYTGYAALCLAEGLREDGKLHTIDVNDELENRVRGYFESSDYSGRIAYHVGNALDIIPKLEEEWELVFIDADKENYARYFDLVIDNVRPGGWIIADNVLWSGKVLAKAEDMDSETAALHAYNQKVATDNRVEQVLLAVRDGLMCCRKR